LVVDDLLVGLVSTHRVGSVKIRVDAGVKLVSHIGVVRTGSVRRGAGAGVEGTTAITVGVDTGVGGVGDAGVVGAVSASGVAVGASQASQARAGVMAVGVGATSNAASGARAETGAGGARVAKCVGAITIGVDARVSSIGNARVVRAVKTLSGTAGGAAGGAEASAGGMCVTEAGTGGVCVSNSLGAVAIRIYTRVGSVGDARVVGAVSTLGGTGAEAAAILAVASSAASGVRAIAIRVHARIGGVGDAGVVGAVGTLRGAMVSLVIGVDLLLDLVDDAGHVGWLFVMFKLSGLLVVALLVAKRVMDFV